MTFSIVIATYNRAGMLRDTLASLAQLRPAAPWEVIVVDNNSPDTTQEVVEEAAAGFPVPLRYAFEREQGRSAALNCGFRLASGDIVVTTDDDVRVEPDWLDQIGNALTSLECDYVGGRVTPIFENPALPAWFPNRPGLLWGVVALLDYGPTPVKYGVRVPLGVNMAMRREAIERAGGFDPSIGRKAGTLLGQEVREWCIRARAAGVRGVYAPELSLRHIIPASRLNKRYFRRWFYWRGISRARLYAAAGLDMEAPEQTAIDFRTVPHVLGVPRYLYRKALASAWHAVTAAVRGDRVAAFDHELWVCFFAGILAERARRGGRPAASPIVAPARTS
jgi:glycosyltransferase involved in cell wall biosynthesis